MENNLSEHVVDVIGIGSDWQLVACNFVLGPVAYWVVKRWGVLTGELWWTLAPRQVPTKLFDIPFDPANPYFPYGYFVIPYPY